MQTNDYDDKITVRRSWVCDIGPLWQSDINAQRVGVIHSFDYDDDVLFEYFPYTQTDIAGVTYSLSHTHFSAQFFIWRYYLLFFDIRQWSIQMFSVALFPTHFISFVCVWFQLIDWLTFVFVWARDIVSIHCAWISDCAVLIIDAILILCCFPYDVQCVIFLLFWTTWDEWIKLNYIL